MEGLRFEKFTLLIDGIHKCIHKIKIDTAPTLGIKGVHVFWLYQLLGHPEGLTAAELAAGSMVDRSLVSREIEYLRDGGYAETEPAEAGRRRGYNSRIKLTDKGKILARSIADEVKQIQSQADEGISAEELCAFYTTLEKLHRNFAKMTAKSGKRNIKSPNYETNEEKSK